MYKGIFWCNVTWFDDEMYTHTLLPVRVRCNNDGNSIENADFSSKSGDNFNHKKEWEKLSAENRRLRNKPFDHYPRGRVEINAGKVKVFANPIILEDGAAKELIIKTFELEEVKDQIKWIADNSKHYQYAVD